MTQFEVNSMWLGPPGAMSSLIGEMEANGCVLIWVPPKAVPETGT